MTTAVDIGFNFHPGWQDTPPAIVSKAIAHGASWGRLDVYWPDLPNATYRGRVKSAVVQLHDGGAKALVVFWGTPGGKPNVPPNTGEYARAAIEMVSELHADAVEIWNEPNSRTFWTGTAREYGRLVASTWRAMLGRVPVIFGGTAHVDLDFYRAALKAGAQFDDAAVHPYPPDPTNATIPTGALRRLHRLVRRPIWATELGWSSSVVGTTAQAQNTAQAFETLSALRFVRMAFVYELLDETSGHPWLDGLGIFRADGTEKPVLDALSLESWHRLRRGAI